MIYINQQSQQRHKAPRQARSLPARSCFPTCLAGGQGWWVQDTVPRTPVLTCPLPQPSPPSPPQETFSRLSPQATKASNPPVAFNGRKVSSSLLPNVPRLQKNEDGTPGIETPDCRHHGGLFTAPLKAWAPGASGTLTWSSSDSFFFNLFQPLLFWELWSLSCSEAAAFVGRTESAERGFERGGEQGGEEMVLHSWGLQHLLHRFSRIPKNPPGEALQALSPAAPGNQDAKHHGVFHSPNAATQRNLRDLVPTCTPSPTAHRDSPRSPPRLQSILPVDPAPRVERYATCGNRIIKN